MRSVKTNPLADELDSILTHTEPLWQELRGGRILILGATGFFGCWLVESFAWANRRLNLQARAVAMSRTPDALFAKAPHLAGEGSIDLHAADVRRGEFPKGSFSHLIHAATEASARLNGEAPLLMFETILEGTRRALSFAVESSVSKFLFTSSGAVYGEQRPNITHLDESCPNGPDPLHPRSAYAEGKRAAELLCALIPDRHLKVPIARCFAFVGPYMPLDAHFAIGNFIGDRLRGGPIRVMGDGTPLRSYLYASDLMIWLWTILFQGRSCRAYNVGSEEALSIATLAGEVVSALPPNVEIDVARSASPGTEVQRYVPSTARAREELGLRVEVPLREAIRRTYAWFAQRGNHA